jgi:hypothetical protein
VLDGSGSGEVANGLGNGGVISGAVALERVEPPACG